MRRARPTVLLSEGALLGHCVCRSKRCSARRVSKTIESTQFDCRVELMPTAYTMLALRTPNPSHPQVSISAGARSWEVAPKKKFSDEHHRPGASPACPRACPEHASLCVHVHISRVPAVHSAVWGTCECTAGSAWAQQGSMATNARKARSGGRICTGVHVHESATRQWRG